MEAEKCAFLAADVMVCSVNITESPIIVDCHLLKIDKAIYVHSIGGHF